MQDKIVWAEGILLSQQYMQQWDHYHKDLYQMLLKFLYQNQHGVIELDIDRESLKNGLVYINSCVVIFKDFQLVHFVRSETQQLICEMPNTTNASFSVYLSIPDNQYIAEVINYNHQNILPRYNVDYRKTPDLYDSERIAEVGFAKNNLIITINETPKNCLSLKIAEIVCSENNEFMLSESYISRSLYLNNSIVLRKLILNYCHLIKNKLKQLKDGNKLRKTNEAIEILFESTLEDILFTLDLYLKQNYVKIEEAYVYITRSINRLSKISDNCKIFVFKTYDADNIFEIFDTTYKTFKRILDDLSTSKTIYIKLIKLGDSLYKTEILSNELIENYDLYLQTREVNMDDDHKRQIISQIKVASSSVMNDLVKNSLPGLIIKTVDSNAFSKSSFRTQHYSISKRGVYWEKVKVEKEMMIYLPITLVNLDFSLFAIKND
ncbi:MAG: type VI secretion system baseplate subunit TssK [Gammaproteobacteria bacterium]